MGAADGDFDVQKYEIDKRIVISLKLLFYVRELLRHIYTRWGITNGVSSKLDIQEYLS
jgi:hypothetical protein